MTAFFISVGKRRMSLLRLNRHISHRMSSCRFCQDILVFQDGCLVERGSHESLLEANGLYSSLWNAQAQYYVK